VILGNAPTPPVDTASWTAGDHKQWAWLCHANGYEEASKVVRLMTPTMAALASRELMRAMLAQLDQRAMALKADAA
jgi:hypothetical protein